MQGRRSFLAQLLATAGAGAAGAMLAPTARAAVPTAWTDWQPAPGGLSLGTAKGVMRLADGSKVGVTYKGPVLFVSSSGLLPSWLPAGTFQGGLVTRAPTIHKMVALVGGKTSAPCSVTFSRPVMAIFSLGNRTQASSFVFDPRLSSAVQSGGPSQEYDGGPIRVLTKLVSGKRVPTNVVAGSEGNGTLLFEGPLSRIGWECTGDEYYCGFTIGAA